MKKIYTNVKELNVDFEGLDIPSQLVMSAKFKDIFNKATKMYISTKNRRSNNAAIKDYIKRLDKSYKYLCVDYQDEFFKNDSVVIAVWSECV